MAITPIVALSVAEAVAPSAATQFTTSFDFVLLADGFKEGEVAILHRLGPSGSYYPATSETGAVFVGARPNIVRVDSGGTFRISKTASGASVAVGYEEIL